MRFNISRKRTTRWNLFFHYSTLLYTVIIGIVLVPLYVQFIPTQEYGYWLASGNILGWISAVDPGFGMVVQQKVAYEFGANNKSKVGKYITSGIVLSLVILILLILAGIVVNTQLIKFLGVTDNSNFLPSLQLGFMYALAGTILTIFSYTITAANQGLQSSLGIGLIYLAANITGICITVYFLNKGYGVVALGGAFLWRGICLFLGNFFYLIKRMKDFEIPWAYDLFTIREMKNLLSVNFLGRIGSIGNTQVASFLIAKVLSPVDTVLYKFTLTIPETSKLILVRPTLALTPSITHLIGEGQLEKAKAILVQLLQYMIWCAGLVLLGFICLNQYFIELWIGSGFYGGQVLNLSVVLWVVISIFTNSLSHIVFAFGNIKMNSLVTFVQSIVYVSLLFIGLHFWGLNGAGFALLIAELSISAWYYPYIFSKKLILAKPLMRSIFIEFIYMIAATSIILVLFFFSGIKISSWFEFCFSVIVIIIAYIILIAVLSEKFRERLKSIFIRLV